MPRFDDDAIKGDGFMEQVERAFKSHALQRYLEDETHCQSNPEWSGAFASRLRESLNESTTLRFIATELDDEDNCQRVWCHVTRHLSTVDMRMARALEQWRKLFDLKCESMDTFLAFYSDVREAMKKLEQAESVAIGDEVFMRAFLCKSIDVPELQTHAKEFMTNTSDNCLDIFEKIHRDYRSIESSEALRTNDLSLNRRARRAIKFKDVQVDPKGKPAAKPRFPPNTGNLIPHKYYGQFKTWFEEMSKPKNERDPNFESTFKFEYLTPKVKTVYRSDHSRQEKRGGNRGRRRRGRSDRSESSGETRRSVRRRRRNNSYDGQDKKSRSRSYSPRRSRSHSRDRVRDRSSEQSGQRTSRKGRRCGTSTNSRAKSKRNEDWTDYSSGNGSPLTGSRNLDGYRYSDTDQSETEKEKPKGVNARTTIDKSAFRA